MKLLVASNRLVGPLPISIATDRTLHPCPAGLSSFAQRGQTSSNFQPVHVRIRGLLSSWSFHSAQKIFGIHNHIQKSLLTAYSD